MDEKLSNSVEVSPASLAEKHIIAHLLQLHEHDISPFCSDEIDEDGLFPYPDFDLYWTTREHTPFLVRARGKIVGFALRVEEEMDDHTLFSFMADFFILKKYRGQGIGQAAAFQLFDQFPGLWTVSELKHNLPAQAFWRTIIGRYTGGQFTEYIAEDGCFVQDFKTPEVLP
jgi:predicted acetyltransferase